MAVRVASKIRREWNEFWLVQRGGLFYIGNCHVHCKQWKICKFPDPNYKKRTCWASHILLVMQLWSYDWLNWFFRTWCQFHLELGSQFSPEIDAFGPCQDANGLVAASRKRPLKRTAMTAAELPFALLKVAKYDIQYPYIWLSMKFHVCMYCVWMYGWMNVYVQKMIMDKCSCINMYLYIYTCM